MRKWILIICLFCVTAEANLVSQLRDLETANDDMGMRVLIRKNFKKKLNITEWSQIRGILSRRPNVGFDVVRAWDNQLTLKGSTLEKDSLKVYKALEKADNLALNEQFDEAFSVYQQVATYIKKSNGGRITRSLNQLYLNVLHQMGRTLYATKRFNDALEVYSWIPPVYAQTRQIMFEKMWAAFRAGKYDIALGAIASQQSEFFSRYLDPESYLIKIYILKRLCREKELKATIDAIRYYMKELKTGTFTYIDWARGDLTRMSLAKLLADDEKNISKVRIDLVNFSERTEEKKKIQAYLQKKFLEEKTRIELQLEKVLGYSAIAVTQEQKLLSQVKSLPESSVLEAQGYELWPASTGEEWTDEIGSHVFIGESQCH